MGDARKPDHDPARRELLRQSLAIAGGATTALSFGITDYRGTTRLSWTVPLAELAVRS